MHEVYYLLRNAAMILYGEDEGIMCYCKSMLGNNFDHILQEKK